MGHWRRVPVGSSMADSWGEGGINNLNSVNSLNSFVDFGYMWL